MLLQRCRIYESDAQRAAPSVMTDLISVISERGVAHGCEQLGKFHTITTRTLSYIRNLTSRAGGAIRDCDSFDGRHASYMLKRRGLRTRETLVLSRVLIPARGT
jgi:hypothetical protein